MFNWIKKLFNKESKRDLRQECIDIYGEEFGECYDMVNQGQAIGGFLDTIIFLDMVEAVKNHNVEKIQEFIDAKKHNEEK